MCKRCGWANKNELMKKYHDEEWGVPLHNDRQLFEFFVLEGFQAGLSWQVVLNKRQAFREAFDNFKPESVANYKQQKLDKLLQNKAIIRNKIKIAATVNNAQRFLEIQQEFGSFDKYIWSFVAHKPIQNTFKTMNDLPSKTVLSDNISTELKKRGFKFVGSIVIYAYMEAIGMVNDHLFDCFRHEKIKQLVEQ